MTSNEMSKRNTHYLELDGLRGLAVIAILTHHIFNGWGYKLARFSPIGTRGWIGVEIFFALSGFLITSILLRSPQNWSGLRLFYVKRAFRIWPLYYLLLAFTGVRAAITCTPFTHWLSCLFLVQNFLSKWPELDLQHTWSLCIEEHYYLVWPLLVILVPRRKLPWILTLVVLASPALRIIAIQGGISTKLLYTATQYRLDAIVMGSLFALVFAKYPEYKRTMTISASALLCICIIASEHELHQHSMLYGEYSAMIYTYLAGISVSLVCLAVNLAGKPITAPLRWRPLRYTGQISYALYMIHPALIALFRSTALSTAVAVPTCIFLSFLGASLSWHYFEYPLQKARKRYESNMQNKSVPAISAA